MQTRRGRNEALRRNPAGEVRYRRLAINTTPRTNHGSGTSPALNCWQKLFIIALLPLTSAYATEELLDFVKLHQSGRATNDGFVGSVDQNSPANPFPIPSPPYDESSFKNRCRHQKLDIVFVLDGSKSVKAHNFQKMLAFTSEMVGNFQIGSEDTQVGVIQYSSCIRPHIWLNNFTDTEQLQSAIARIKFEAKGTATGKALRFASNRMFNWKKGARELSGGVRRVLILVTDGRWSVRDDIPGALASLESKQVERFAVGVGRVVKTLDLGALVSEPKSNHSFHIPSFDELDEVGRQILSTICQQKECGNGNVPQLAETGFDLIQLTGMDTRFDVSHVRGSNELSTAYSIGPQTDIQLSPTSILFPRQFPTNFGIFATFRMSDEARDQDWILLELKDPQDIPMFSIRILGAEKKQVHFMMRAYNGETCLYEFHDVSRLFQPGYHTVALYVENIIATLTIDCELIGQYLLTSQPYLGDTDGRLVISKHVTGADSTVHK
ncbi:collagen alpha-1(XXII) chain-like [Ciona intestinalis]